jgi:hypothetical protein
MSTNLDTLRRTLGSAAAALLLLGGGASQAVAQHSRSDARPSSSSSSGSTAARPSSSSSSHSGSGGSASSTRPSGGSGSPTRIENDSRNHRYRGGGHYGGHYYGGRYGYGGYYGYGPRWGWYGIWNSPWYWGGGYGYPYSTSVTVYPNGQYGNLGALDLDLAPERVEVYVDGQRVGVADDFDGFPTYLWLEQGTYDVVFYMPGFKTLARQYSIYPGLIIDVEDTLEPGDAVRPEDLATKTHERRDARVLEDRQREQQYRERGSRPRPLAPRQDWRERAPGAPGAPGAVIEPRQGDDQSRDVRGEPGTLRLRVEPSDASIYLDGRFIGTAEELSDLRSGLIVDAGTHRLEVVRPGWRSETRSFEAVAGDDVEVEIELDEQ